MMHVRAAERRRNNECRDDRDEARGCAPHDTTTGHVRLSCLF